jgi:hypothetical protein
MADAEKRRLERLSEEGDAGARVQLLRQRAREGSLLPWRLELAAYAGDVAAFEALAPDRQEALRKHEWTVFRPTSDGLWSLLDGEDALASIRAASAALARAVDFCATSPAIAKNLREIHFRLLAVPSREDLGFVQGVVEAALLATAPARVRDDLASVAASASALLGTLEGKGKARAAFEAALRPSGQALDAALQALSLIPKRPELAAYVGAEDARATIRPQLAFKNWTGGLELWGKTPTVAAMLACCREQRGGLVESVAAWFGEPSRALAKPVSSPESGARLDLSQHALGLPDWSSVSVARELFASLPRNRQQSALAAVAAFALSEEPLFRFAGYEVLEELEHRRLGEVYRASDSREGDLLFIGLDTPVPEPEFTEVTRPLATLDHPNLARLVRAELVGEGDVRGAYLVQARAHGVPLATWLATDLTPDERRAIVRGILEGLEHAHAHGVVHGALGGASVVIDHGTARIVDHGHAALTELADWESRDEDRLIQIDPACTPELFLNAPTRYDDRRSDVYGAAALAAWILTGRPAFGGERAELARKILHEEPGPLAYRDAVLRRALAKDPAKRFPTLAAFRAALLDE